MSSKTSAVFATLLLALLAASPARATLCYDKCIFRFCNFHVSFTTGRGTPDIAFTRAICLKQKEHNRKVGIVGRSGETRVMIDGKAVPISQWHPAGLKENFRASFFKTFIIEPEGNISGIGHETVHRNQKDFLNDKCFVVPLEMYVKLNQFDTEIANVFPSTDEPLKNCIAFKSFSF